jgi:peptidoglycan/LPS O-acetylase OafA/YrhL
MLRFLTGRRAGWFLAGGLALVAVTHGALRLRPKPLVFLALVHAVAGLAVAGLVVRGVCRGRMPILRNRVLGWFGLVSYSLYLWHWPLLAEASARWGATGPVMAGAVAVAIAVSVLSYAILERPFLRSRSSPRTIEPEKDQRWLGSNTEATIANSPWSISSSSAELAPFGNST